MLVALIVTSTFQMVEQLLPFVRFDGYYLLCDLAGVPDLFSRVSPTLRGGAAADATERSEPAAARAQRVVTTWVAIVVPLLVLAPSASCSGCPRGS